ncbi:hypothetical protein HDU79_008369 [Rhizoclosmatium sp. JEL0117]|nr:hypothetical protein HDU79_008369 [Rhizoclosmatium sp. JEL0117]
MSSEPLFPADWIQHYSTSFNASSLDGMFPNSLPSHPANGSSSNQVLSFPLTSTSPSLAGSSDPSTPTNTSSTTTTKRKPGRKHTTEPPRDKRQIQTRTAQQKYQEKKKAYIQGLESRVALCDREHSQFPVSEAPPPQPQPQFDPTEVYTLRARVASLEAEVSLLKTQLAMQPFVDPRFINVPSQPNNLFGFPGIIAGGTGGGSQVGFAGGFRQSIVSGSWPFFQSGGGMQQTQQTPTMMPQSGVQNMESTALPQPRVSTGSQSAKGGWDLRVLDNVSEEERFRRGKQLLKSLDSLKTEKGEALVDELSDLFTDLRLKVDVMQAVKKQEGKPLIPDDADANMFAKDCMRLVETRLRLMEECSEEDQEKVLELFAHVRKTNPSLRLNFGGFIKVMRQVLQNTISSAIAKQ